MDEEICWRGLGIDLEAFTTRELSALNRALVARFDYLMDLRRRAALDRFAVGDRVMFDWRCLIVEAVVEAITPRRLRVRAMGRRRYVDPLLVRSHERG